MTARCMRATSLRCLMTDQPAFRNWGKIAEKWRELAERRRDDFARLYRSGRWKRYYDNDSLLAQTREIAEICERWTKVLEQHRRTLSEPDAGKADAPKPAAESDVPTTNRDAA
jgi:hypothetical protein